MLLLLLLLLLLMLMMMMMMMMMAPLLLLPLKLLEQKSYSVVWAKIIEVEAAGALRGREVQFCGEKEEGKEKTVN